MADKKDEANVERGLWDILNDLDERCLELADINMLLTTHDECITDDLMPFKTGEKNAGDQFAHRWSVHQATLNVIRRQLLEIADGLQSAISEGFVFLRASRNAQSQ